MEAPEGPVGTTAGEVNADVCPRGLGLVWKLNPGNDTFVNTAKSYDGLKG